MIIFVNLGLWAVSQIRGGTYDKATGLVFLAIGSTLVGVPAALFVFQMPKKDDEEPSSRRKRSS